MKIEVRRLQSHERSDWTLPNRVRFAAFFDGVSMGLRPPVVMKTAGFCGAGPRPNVVYLSARDPSVTQHVHNFETEPEA
jgi:hypothetical protein